MDVSTSIPAQIKALKEFVPAADGEQYLGDVSKELLADWAAIVDVSELALLAKLRHKKLLAKEEALRTLFWDRVHSDMESAEIAERNDKAIGLRTKDGIPCFVSFPRTTEEEHPLIRMLRGLADD